MNKTTIVRAIGNHVLLIYNDYANIYVPNDKTCFDPEEIDYMIEVLNRTKQFYYDNQNYIKYHEELKQNIHQEKIDSVKEKINRKKRKGSETNIYIMIDDQTGHYKIGRSVSPLKREATLLSQKSSIRLLFYFPSFSKVEIFIHEMFENKRVRGEWFELNNEDLELIKKIGGVL